MNIINEKKRKKWERKRMTSKKKRKRKEKENTRFPPLLLYKNIKKYIGKENTASDGGFFVFFCIRFYRSKHSARVYPYKSAVSFYPKLQYPFITRRFDAAIVMWNIARSAEAMFSRWVVKRALKFFLKKKLGHVILGDIDVDQLDEQLGEGIVQLSDLALNADYINQKLHRVIQYDCCGFQVGTSMRVIVKEGSIGFLSVKMPWKGDGCHIEADEIELVLAPRMDGPSYVGTDPFSGPEGNSCFRNGSRKVDHEIVDFAATPASVDVHEEVKTVAKMVKWFLTSFHVKIKNLLVAFDPCLENVERIIRSPMTLVLHIRETECGTHLSEDVNLKGNAENILGISRLTNFFKFQGAVMELLQSDKIDKSISLSDGSGSTFGELFSGSYSPSATIPILSGKRGGFSGTLKLSIPWKNGSLDICKVDSEIYMDPLDVKLYPILIKWTILTCESLRNFDIDGKSHKADSVYYNSASQFNSSIAGSSPIVADKVSDKASLIHGDYRVELCSTQASPEIFTDFLLPGSNFIFDWVPFSAHKNQKENAEGFSASSSQFFDCFDEMRSSLSTSFDSGIWTWISSVVSAIIAASHLTSGSLHSPGVVLATDIADGMVSSPLSQLTASIENPLWGWVFLMFGIGFFLLFCFAAIITEFLPPSENYFVSAIQTDKYYCLLVPLTLPILLLAVYFHWLSMKVFKHA